VSTVCLSAGGAPGRSHVVSGGAGGVGDPQVAEGEDAGRAGLSGAGGQLGGVLRAGGVLGGGAVPPPVGHHRVVRVHHGGAPRGRRVGVGAPVVIHAVVGERENARIIGLNSC
jgi:hypothetical protein